MSYKYKQPEGRLTKVSVRKWNNKFAYRGRWPLVAYVYYTDERAVIHYKVGLLGKALLFTALPLIYPLGVIQVGHSEAVDDIKRIFFQNKYGSFSSDVMYKNSDGWFKLKALLGHYD